MSGDADAKEHFEANVRAMLQDMLDNSTTCGCCDNMTAYQALFVRTCRRFPSHLWPVNAPTWMLAERNKHPAGVVARTLRFLVEERK